MNDHLLQDWGDAVFIIKLYLFYLILLCRYSFGDPKLKKFIDFNNESLRIFGNGLPADFVPILKYFPDKKTKKVLAFVQTFLDEIAFEMKAHRETFDPSKCNGNLACNVQCMACNAWRVCNMLKSVYLQWMFFFFFVIYFKWDIHFPKKSRRKNCFFFF